MAVHKLMVRCYRTTPGDAGCLDVPTFVEDGYVEDIVEQAGALLLAYSEAPNSPPERRPQAAHLEDEQGQVVARLRIAGPGKIVRVAN